MGIYPAILRDVNLAKQLKQKTKTMKKVMYCFIVLIIMITTSCQEDRKVLFDYQNISPPDHEGLDSLGMADFFKHARIDR
jgi:hypothetical protein